MKKVMSMILIIMFLSVSCFADVAVTKVSQDTFIQEEVEAVAEVYEFPVYKTGIKADGTEVQIRDERAIRRTRATLEQINAQISVLEAKKLAITNLNKVVISK